MREADKTKEQLIVKPETLHWRIAELEKIEAERKQVEEALQAEKNKLQSIINAMEDGLTIQDADYNIIYQNELVRKIFGDHLGEKCYRVYEGKDKLCNGCPVEKAFKDGKSHTSERRVVIPSGEITFWENTANPVRDAKGRVVSCLEIDRNITERKRMEEALQDSEEKLRKMFESVTEGISVIDLKGIITEVNQRTVEMHGFSSKDELLGKSAFKLVAPRDHEKIAKNMRQALRRGTTIRGVEYTLVKADGSEFPGELSTSVLKDTSGNVVGHITIARDITERKQAEELFKIVTNSSPIGIYIVQDRKFQLVNPQFQKLTNYTEDELVGMDSLALVLPEDRDMVIEKAVKMLKGESSSPYQFRVVSKTGETRWVMETVTSIQYRGRRATLGNYMDITERKRMEEQLMMTEQLASVGELASGIAHELNNPLTSVIGFSQLLMERNIADNDIKEDLGLIYSEAQRAAGIVKNLLTFARKHMPVKQLSQINKAIEDVLKLRAYEQKVNNIEVNRQFASDLPEIMVDYFQMQQVFLNIIINAEYFMTQAHNKGMLTITTERLDNIVRISFADDGPGIPKENLSRIFNPFFTTKEVGKGTGLGLSICHGIVTGHGGNIYAKNQPGKGATFVVELPINSF